MREGVLSEFLRDMNTEACRGVRTGWEMQRRLGRRVNPDK